MHPTDVNTPVNPTRRDFLSLTAFAAGWALLPPHLRSTRSRRRAETTFRWETITPNTRVAFGSGGNSLIVVNRGEALLVDTKVAGFGQILAREAHDFGATIRTVVNTHQRAPRSRAVHRRARPRDPRAVRPDANARHRARDRGSTDRAGLQRQRDYFDHLRDAVGAAITQGRTRAECVALKPAAVADLGWPDQLPDTLGVVYDELTARR